MNPIAVLHRLGCLVDRWLREAFGLCPEYLGHWPCQLPIGHQGNHHAAADLGTVEWYDTPAGLT